MSDLKLIEAVKAGDQAAAEALIEQGVDINQQDEQDWTPLNFAAGRGDLVIVKLLVERGADILKVGRDRRTPYMIALAAGRTSVAKYLREMEDKYSGEKAPQAERKYCKAYHLGDLRKYPAWTQTETNDDERNGGSDVSFPDDKIVFVHQDFTVTESVWRNENVLFNNVDSNWREFCANSLNFQVPDDLDLIVANEQNT